MAKDLFRPGEPADLIPEFKLPESAPRRRGSTDVGLSKVGGGRGGEDIFALLDQFPVVAEPKAATPASKGWGQTLYEGVMGGVETAGLGMTGQTSRDPAAISRQLKDTQIPRSGEEQAFDQETAGAAKAFDDAEGFGAKFSAGLDILRVMARNPKQAAGTVAQSLGMSAPAFAAAGAGALAGSALGPVGTAVGAFTGYLLGNFATNIQAETAQKIEAELQSRGVNTDDPAAVERAIRSDPAFVDIVREYGIKKGSATSAVETVADVATAGVASKASKLIKAGETALSRAGRGTAAAGGAMAAQGVSEGLGSAAGSAAVGEDVSWGQALTEGAYGAVAGVPDAALAWRAGTARGEAPAPGVAPDAPEGAGGPAGGPLAPAGGPEARFVGRDPATGEVTYTPPLEGPPGRPQIGKDPAQPADWELVNDDPRQVGGVPPAPQLGYDQKALPGPDGQPPALGRPESVGPGFTVDAQGNVVPTTPEQRMADQARGGDAARREGWLGGAVDRLTAEEERRMAGLGLTPDVREAQANRTEPWREEMQPGDVIFDGKRPFMFRSSAERVARKTGGEVVPVDGGKGFVVRSGKAIKAPKAPAGPKVPKRQQFARDNPFLAFLGKYGVKLDHKLDITGEPGREGNKFMPYYGWMFRRDGLPLDLLVEPARSAGFLTQADIDNPEDTGGTRKLAEMIMQAQRGQMVMDAATAERAMEAEMAMEQEGEGEFDWDSLADEVGVDEELEAEREAIIAEAQMLVDEASDDQLDALLGATLDAEGLTDEEAWNALGGDTDVPARAEPGGPAAGAQEPAGAVAQGAGEGRPDGGQEAGAPADFALTGQTPDEVKQQTAKQERDAAEKARRDAAPSADEFVLSGSDRPADKARAQGQTELDEAPAPAAPKPKPSPNAKPTYAARKVAPETAQKIIEWARKNGFKSTLKPEDLHVTIAYSRDPIDVAAVEPDENGDELVVYGGWRKVEPLGDKGAVVLKFGSGELESRWQQYRDAGASWDWDEYQAHITITYDGAGVDLSKVKKFAGPIVLGPEYTTDLDVDAVDKVEEVPATKPSVTKRANDAVKAAAPDKRREEVDRIRKVISDGYRALGDTVAADMMAKPWPADKPLPNAADIAGWKRALEKTKGEQAKASEPPKTVTQKAEKAVAKPKPPKAPPAADKPIPKRSPRQTASEAFAKWFGDSKVVDDNGEPLRVYHGTTKDFAAFDPNAPRTAIPLPGMFFSPDPEVASLYASYGRELRDYEGFFVGAEGGNVKPVYLSMQNPMDIDASDGVNRGLVPGSVIREMIEDAQRKGHDGVILRGWRDGSGPVQYIVFRPEQIKSAIGNDGSFDPTNPDITRSPRTGARRNLLGNLFGSRRVANPSRAQDDALYDLREALGRQAATSGLDSTALDGLSIATVPYNARPIAAALKQLFGVDIVFVHGAAALPKQLSFNGIYTGGRRVFIAADSARPFHQVIGHEFLHWLKRSSPDAYEDFTRRAAPFLKARATAERAGARSSEYEGYGISDDQQKALGWEEVYADVFGDAWADPAFWSEFLGSLKPKLAQTIANRWRMFWLRIRLALTGKAVEAESANPLVADLLKDAGQVRAVIASVMAAQARGGATAPAGGAAVRTPRQTATEAFRSWFGESKVVDSIGKPKVMYRGRAPDSGNVMRSSVPYFTDVREYAAEYAEEGDEGGEVVGAYLSIKNPASRDDVLRVLEDLGREPLVEGRETAYLEQQPEVVAALKARGFDGVTGLDDRFDDRGEMTSWAPFSPEQIKSATDNDGSFDPANPDITRSPRSLKSRLRKEGRQPQSKEEASRWLSDGWSMFVSHEMDEGQDLTPVTSDEQFDGYQPEQIIGLPPSGPAVMRSARGAAKEAGDAIDRLKQGGGFKDYRRAMSAWFERRTEVMGSLPDRTYYLTERYKTLGTIARYEEIAEGIRDTFADASAKDKGQLYAYLTTKGASTDLIENAALRKKAEDTKYNIGVVGDALVRAGMLPQASREKYRDQYLPRLYLAHLLKEDDWRAIGAGKKPSDMGYLKARQDIPEEVRRVILGEVKDPGYLAAMAIVRPMRDVALLEFMTKITGRDGLVLPESVMEWQGRKVTPIWLKNEADRLRHQSRYMEDRGDAAKAVALADRMDRAADPVMDRLRAGVHTDWKQLPDSPRYGRLRGLYVRREVFDDLVGVYELTPEDLHWADPRSIFGYGGTGTKITQAWKVGKVTLNPGSQVRNMVSNMVMLQLSGVSLPMVVPRVVQAIRQIKDGGPAWEIAKKYGVTEVSFTSQELIRLKRDAIKLQLDTEGMHPLRRMQLMATAIAAPLINKAGDFHQMMEQIGKTAKIIDEMAKGKDEATAALEAQKWLFDYSLVPQWVRYARNAPIGSPFLTWMFKSAPRMAEVAALHPQRLLPWVGLMASLPYLAAMAVGGDDDDWRTMKELLPEWARKRGHVSAVPMRDSAGRIQFMDLGPYLPWTMWTDFIRNTARGEPAQAAGDLGSALLSGGPIGSLLMAMATGVDPFTDREIVPKGEPPSKQAAAWMSYVWTLAMPPVITEQGFAGKVYQAASGNTNRYGDPRTTGGQAAMNLLGLNLYGINPDTTVAMEMSKMSREINDTKIRLMQRLQDRGLSAEKRQEIMAEYSDEIRRRAKKAGEYIQKANTLSPELRVQLEKTP